MAEKIITRDICEDGKGAFLDYAMDVIVDRALPDVRDGCKPVHRRILYAMYETGNTCKKPYKKSARTVGEVLGKYHPHGDSSVYGAMVRMAQPFSLRYPLVDGHGNFGSIDGDGAAAMRYTEARMSRLSDTMLEDIDKDTVNMKRNYDESLFEPRVLPAKLPNLLVNGTEGIAVGFASGIPPHTVSEVLEGIIAKIDDPSLDSLGLMKYIKGPDFPGGGTIQGTGGIVDMYTTGAGAMTVRSDYIIEDVDKGKRKQIVFTNVPYQVIKTNIVSKIELLSNDHIEKKGNAETKVKAATNDIAEVRDESTARDGVRIVVELKKNANVAKVIRLLYKHTQLQSNYNAKLIALKPLPNDKLAPFQYTLLGIVNAYIEHRKEVVGRKYKFLLEKAEARKHIVDGLVIAVNAIDEVVKTIKSSKDKSDACTRLCSGFGLDEPQALAVLEYRLQSLTGLEVDKLMEELASIEEAIKKYKHILSSDETILAEVRKDCSEMLQTYGDERVTKIQSTVEDDDEDDVEAIDDKEMVVTISDTGYVKSVPLTEFSAQRRGGKGVKSVKAANTDNVKQIISTNKKNVLLCIGNDGRAYRLPVASIEESSRTARGQYVNNLIEASSEVEVVSIIGVKRDKMDKGAVLFFTERGDIKKIAVSELVSRNRSVMALKVKEGDSIVNAAYTEDESGLAFVATRNGKLLKFDYGNLRNKGRAASTQRCMKLADGDYVISADIIHEGEDILTVTNTGIGKKSSEDSYTLRGLGGVGVINYKTTSNVFVAAVVTVKEDDDILVACDNGKLIRVHSDSFRSQSRGSRGQNLVNLEGNESVVGASSVVRDDNESEKEKALPSAEGDPSETV